MATAATSRPPIIIPELPDSQALQALIGTPSGLTTSLVDLFQHVRNLGQSVQTALSAHYSSNNTTHDQLEAQIELNRTQLTERSGKSDTTCDLIS